MNRVFELQHEIAMSDLPIKELMGLICVRVQGLTKATGSCIEIIKGRQLVYESAAGALENAQGMSLSVENSLSGMALRQNQILHCSDTEKDDRVDRKTCAKLGVRSMIVVPLQMQGAPRGVLKVAHGSPGRFDVNTIGLLRLMMMPVAARLAHAGAMTLLRMSESKFRCLFENSWGGVVISRDGLLLDANDRFCKMVGCDRREITGRQMTWFVHADSRNQVEKLTSSAADGPYEARFVRKDGSAFMAEVNGRTIAVDDQSLRVDIVAEIPEALQLKKQA